MHLQAILFDFDGVIADTEPLHHAALQRVLEPQGCGFPWETYTRDYIGFDDRDALRHAFAAKGRDLTRLQLAELMEAKAHAFLDLIADGSVQPYPGVLDLIRLAASRMPVALCTGALRSDVAPLLAQFGVARLFQCQITAEDVVRSKPDPETYARAVAHLNLPASACLAIEDTPAGLQSARAAGCRTLGVTHTHRASDLFAHADRVVESLAGLELSTL